MSRPLKRTNLTNTEKKILEAAIEYKGITAVGFFRFKYKTSKYSEKKLAGIYKKMMFLARNKLLRKSDHLIISKYSDTWFHPTDLTKDALETGVIPL